MGHPEGSRLRPVTFNSMRALGAAREFSTQLQVFAMHHSDHESLTLDNGDRVLPGDSVEIDPDEDMSGTAVEGEPWTAKVLEIKSDRKSRKLKDLFVKIHWYYTESNLDLFDVKWGEVTGLPSCNFGKNELVLSNHEQIICADSIVKKVDVHLFDEADPSPLEVFVNEDRWYRYAFIVESARLVTPKHARLPAARCGVKTCHARYTPDVEYQRYCARCGHWFHEECLKRTGFTGRGYPLNLRPMLIGTPGFDDTDTLDLDYLKELERDMHRTLDDNDNSPIPSDLIRNRRKWRQIRGLIWCATTPIIRGQTHNVVGTGRDVEEARDLIAQMMRSPNQAYWPCKEELEPFKKWTWKRPDWTVAFRCNRCNGRI